MQNNSDANQPKNIKSDSNLCLQSVVTDHGPNPLVVDIKRAAQFNDTYRTALWTGSWLQLTLMSIQPGDDIGLEMHPCVDQFLHVVDGRGLVQMGESQNCFTLRVPVFNDFAIIIPAGTWHNVTNTGNTPLQLYSIYGPPNHPWGTVEKTKEDAAK